MNIDSSVYPTFQVIQVENRIGVFISGIQVCELKKELSKRVTSEAQLPCFNSLQIFRGSSPSRKWSIFCIQMTFYDIIYFGQNNRLLTYQTCIFHYLDIKEVHISQYLLGVYPSHVSKQFQQNVFIFSLNIQLNHYLPIQQDVLGQSTPLAVIQNVAQMHFLFVRVFYP